MPMGEYVLREACRQVKTWRSGHSSHLWVSVNLSGRQFTDHGFLEQIGRSLKESNLPGESLQLEITESVAMKDLTYSAKAMHNLDRLGIRISLDDFGNGYSSLGYLNRFPIKVLKIDRSFVADIGRNPNSEAIAAAMISMGHALDMKVVAEGVENERQLDFLQSFACDRIQGHLFSRALPPRHLAKILAQAV